MPPSIEVNSSPHRYSHEAAPASFANAAGSPIKPRLCTRSVGVVNPLLASVSPIVNAFRSAQGDLDVNDELRSMRDAMRELSRLVETLQRGREVGFSAQPRPACGRADLAAARQQSRRSITTGITRHARLAGTAL